MSIEAALKRKIGPLPTWAWGGIAGVGLFVYTRYFSGASGDEEPEADYAVEEMYPTAAGGFTPGSSGDGGGTGWLDDWLGDEETEPTTPLPGDLGSGGGVDSTPDVEAGGMKKDRLLTLQNRRRRLAAKLSVAKGAAQKRKLQKRLALTRALHISLAKARGGRPIAPPKPRAQARRSGSGGRWPQQIGKRQSLPARGGRSARPIVQRRLPEQRRMEQERRGQRIRHSRQAWRARP